MQASFSASPLGVSQGFAGEHDRRQTVELAPQREAGLSLTVHVGRCFRMSADGGITFPAVDVRVRSLGRTATVTLPLDPPLVVVGPYVPAADC